MIDFGNTPQAVVAAVFAHLQSNERFSGSIDWSAVGRRNELSWTSCQEIWEAGILNAADLADVISTLHGAARADLDSMQRQREPLAGLSRRYLREAWSWPFMTAAGPSIAIADPSRIEEINAVRIAVGYDAPIVIASFEELKICFERQSHATVDAAPQRNRTERRGVSDVQDLERLQDLVSGEPVVNTVEALFEAAVNLSATDIHIEPGPTDVGVRLRVDGLLRLHRTLPAEMARAVISRVKILAGLDIAETRLPQDGRARARVGDAEVDLRMATMPTLHGEAAVVRLLLKEARALDLAHLGMSARDLSVVHEQLEEPHGLLIVSGPTGSGKTTTLAAALSLLNRPDRKIMTIEDPIEYQIPGIHQTQVKPSIGLTFETALRSFLRHDPNVLMVGEMRNRETASVGVQAALTGHLVLTTLHTNSAVDSVLRLSDLGVESFLLASVLRCVIGQRLVRKLCDRCKCCETTLPAQAAGLADKGLLRLEPGQEFFVPKGCEWCGRTGYRGRIGVFEVLKLDSETRSTLRLRLDATEIAERARSFGMTTMLEDGLTKVLAGTTSFDEVFRATSADGAG
jgi:general secretion pathway protein E